MAKSNNEFDNKDTKREKNSITNPIINESDANDGNHHQDAKVVAEDEQAFKLIRGLLQEIMLRRTKDMECVLQKHDIHKYIYIVYDLHNML